MDTTSQQLVGNTYETQNLSVTENAAMLTTAFSTTLAHSYVKIFVVPTAVGKLTLERTNGETTTAAIFNSNVNLTAGALAELTFKATRGETYQLKYNATTTLKELYIMEIL